MSKRFIEPPYSSTSKLLIELQTAFVAVNCVCIVEYGSTGYHKVANSARGQLNRENDIFLVLVRA